MEEFIRQLWMMPGLLLSVLLGFAIGFERKLRFKEAGIRTHTIVCVGSALMTIISTNIGNGDPGRIAAQIVTGIGFLGAGMIVYKQHEVKGLTTAAGLWCAATIGLALGAGFYEGAIIAFIVTVISIVLLHRIERIINDKHSSFGVYTEISSDKEVRKCIDFLIEHFGARDIQVTAPRSGITGNVGIESSVCPSIKNNTMNVKDVTRALEEIEYVVFAIESI